MRIKEKRLESGLTQEALAALLGLTQGAIFQWENGLTAPDARRLPEIAKALNCTIDELFDEDE